MPSYYKVDLTQVVEIEEVYISMTLPSVIIIIIISALRLNRWIRVLVSGFQIFNRNKENRHGQPFGLSVLGILCFAVFSVFKKYIINIFFLSFSYVTFSSKYQYILLAIIGY